MNFLWFHPRLLRNSRLILVILIIRRLITLMLTGRSFRGDRRFQSFGRRPRAFTWWSVGRVIGGHPLSNLTSRVSVMCLTRVRVIFPSPLVYLCFVGLTELAFMTLLAKPLIVISRPGRTLVLTFRGTFSGDCPRLIVVIILIARIVFKFVKRSWRRNGLSCRSQNRRF